MAMNEPPLNYEFRPVSISDLPRIYNLLQQLSNFKPNPSLHHVIFEAFNSQAVDSLACILDNQIVAVGFIYYITNIIT